MSIPAPAALVRRHVRAARTLIPAALAGDAKAVHKLRVSSRRLRELLPVIAGASPNRPARTLRRLAQQLTRAFGPVREMDVAAELLRTLETHRRIRGIASVRRTVEAEGRRRRRELLKRVDRADLLRRLDRLGAQMKTIDMKTVGRQAPAAVAARVLARAAGLEAAVDAAGALYDPDALHRVRIAGKKLRYSLELVAELRLGRVTLELRRLKAAQKLLGSLHDLHVLSDVARQLHTTSTASLHFIDVLEGELRRHHAEYLRMRPVLADVIARARECGEDLAEFDPGVTIRAVGVPDSAGEVAKC
ncbi:MAG: CHAD domain-containing protein [Acidobacteria bacterium]|nr:CHAD domain-containing protein [Acidobacteriota bacterium]